MKPPKIRPCPRCYSTDGPGIIEGIKTAAVAPRSYGRRFRVGCPCGTRGPWATTVRRAIEVWNDRSL